MNLKVISDSNEDLELSEVKVGDMILCDDGNYHEVRNVVVVGMKGYFIRLSNYLNFRVPPRFKIKTLQGFKAPEAWDIVHISKKLQPVILTKSECADVRFYYDIMIDGNMITREGIVFRFGD